MSLRDNKIAVLRLLGQESEPISLPELMLRLGNEALWIRIKAIDAIMKLIYTMRRARLYEKQVVGHLITKKDRTWGVLPFMVLMEVERQVQNF